MTYPAHSSAYDYAAPNAHVYPHAHGYAGTCEACGVVGQTKHVSIMYNVGALVVRFHKTMAGQLCKRCISDYFFKYTLTTLFLGWWGVISFFVSLFTLPMNLVAFLGSLGMQQPSDEAYAQAPWAAHRGIPGWKLGAIIGGVSAAAFVALGVASLVS